MSKRQDIRLKKRCVKQNLRLLRQLRSKYFEGGEKDYNKVLVCVLTQYKTEQEELDEMLGGGK